LRFPIPAASYLLSAVLTHADPEIETYRRQCSNELARATTLFHELENIGVPKNTDTVLLPLNEVEIVLGKSASKASLFYNTHPSEAIRDIAENQQKEITKLYSEISLSLPLFEACKSVDVSKADPQTQRYLEHTLRDFRRSGVDQPEAARKRITEINDELTELGQEFSMNTRKDVRSITLASTNELAGLPADYIAAHQPDENGEIKITTDYPDYIPFSRYAENDAARLALYKAFKSRAYPANEKILKDILIKRYELANLVGYNNYAEFVTETKMVIKEGFEIIGEIGNLFKVERGSFF
jgi:thimet oligopeptidase